VTRLASLALVALLVSARASAAPLDVTVRLLESFGSTGGPEGVLEFLGGLDVSSQDRRFGGFSGIDMIDAETAFIVSDSAAFVRARLVHEDGRLVGLSDVDLQGLFPNGDMSKQAGDAEDVALDPGNPSHGVIVRERQANAMLTFDLVEGRPENIEPELVGAPDHVLRSNRGLESVAYAPPGSPLAGEVVAIAEHNPRGEADIPGWIAGKGGFTIVRRDEYDISSARFLPDGDLMLLERRYSPAWGIAMRLRRIPGDTIEVGAKVDGEIVLDAGMTSQIDNMEGLAISQDDAGRTILTIVSDDNFSVLQRTLILQFALVDD